MKSFNFFYKFFFKVILFVFLVSFYNCKKTITYYVGPQGELNGMVVLYDRDSVLPDRSGVLVYADGSNPLVQAVTDKDGRFSLKNLSTGIYDIVFQKDGFCTYKLVSYQFVGGNEPMDISWEPLFKKPDFQISNLSITFSDYDGYTINADLSTSNQSDIRIYFGDSPDVSYRHYLITGRVSGNNNKIASFTFYTGNDFMSSLKTQNARKIYFIAYPCVLYDLTYIDIATGTNMYFINTSKPSNISSFDLPN